MIGKTIEYPRVQPGWRELEPRARRCCLCGLPALPDDPLDAHHVFGGARRPLSERDGLVVLLHHSKCHLYGKDAVHRNADTARRLQRAAERAWLSYDPARTVQDFVARYGRNYL